MCKCNKSLFEIDLVVKVVHSLEEVLFLNLVWYYTMVQHISKILRYHSWALFDAVVFVVRDKLNQLVSFSCKTEEGITTIYKINRYNYLLAINISI